MSGADEKVPEGKLATAQHSPPYFYVCKSIEAAEKLKLELKLNKAECRCILWNGPQGLRWSPKIENFPKDTGVVVIVSDTHNPAGDPLKSPPTVSKPPWPLGTPAAAEEILVDLVTKEREASAREASIQP